MGDSLHVRNGMHPIPPFSGRFELTIPIFPDKFLFSDIPSSQNTCKHDLHIPEDHSSCLIHNVQQ